MNQHNESTAVSNTQQSEHLLMAILAETRRVIKKLLKRKRIFKKVLHLVLHVRQCTSDIRGQNLPPRVALAKLSQREHHRAGNTKLLMLLALFTYTKNNEETN
jgi:hypothetical protein